MTVFGSEGIVLDGPVGRADFEDQLPSIFVDRPAFGAALGNPGASPATRTSSRRRSGSRSSTRPARRSSTSRSWRRAAPAAAGRSTCSSGTRSRKAQWGTLRVVQPVGEGRVAGGHPRVPGLADAKGLIQAPDGDGPGDSRGPSFCVQYAGAASLGAAEAGADAERTPARRLASRSHRPGFRRAGAVQAATTTMARPPRTPLSGGSKRGRGVDSHGAHPPCRLGQSTSEFTSDASGRFLGRRLLAPACAIIRQARSTGTGRGVAQLGSAYRSGR